MEFAQVVRRVAEMAGLSLDDDRIDRLGPLVDELMSQLNALRRLDSDDVEQLEPAFAFLPAAWTNRPS
jgi:hypothetical protein